MTGNNENSIIERLKLAVDKKTAGNLKEFARRCDIPYRTLQSYISGDREPGAANLAKIVTQLYISIDWLLTGEGPMERPLAAREIAYENIPKENVKRWLDDFWATASDQDKKRLLIRLERTFPEYEDWLAEKEQESVVSHLRKSSTPEEEKKRRFKSTGTADPES